MRKAEGPDSEALASWWHTPSDASADVRTIARSLTQHDGPHLGMGTQLGEDLGHYVQSDGSAASNQTGQTNFELLCAVGHSAQIALAR